MPKISDQHREQRRAQILDAAWRCIHREGVQATTMEEIIAEAGLSASAMYRYFSGKEDIVVSAITTSLRGLSERLVPLIDATDDLGVPELVARIGSEIRAFSARRGFDLVPIAVHGWSEAQRNERVRAVLREFYGAFRARLADRVRRWQRDGAVAPRSDPAEVAEVLLSLVLGFVAQAAIMGDVDPAAHRRGLAALARTTPPAVELKQRTRSSR